MRHAVARAAAVALLVTGGIGSVAAPQYDSDGDGDRLTAGGEHERGVVPAGDSSGAPTAGLAPLGGNADGDGELDTAVLDASVLDAAVLDTDEDGTIDARTREAAEDGDGYMDE
ncbi:hypothetical protein [Streptomyces cavernicola]|uniref:EF-hand domain-containing protein n=1 Tax=Streptomyces cavernicola TaxID=3043613 RepID=A0ABT6S2S6_9ACTN|nr:hypothetical protein [Streptomyces sp. B-S-A6]MDI3402393.1 hypothetical protein [Streptomyces sp. B-S-A6]